MSFWTDKDLLEPHRTNRWYINFSRYGFKDNIYALKEVKKPSVEIAVKEHKLINHYFRYPGVAKWNPIDVKMVSTRNKNPVLNLPDVLNEYLVNAGYINPKITQTFEDRHTGINKDQLIIEAGSLEIFQLDANGEKIEGWKLYNSFISKIDYGSLTYENDGFVDISFTIQYDWAELDKSIGNTSEENKPIAPGTA